jgi:hypothetical protein
VWLSGAEGEEFTPAFALYMGVFDPIQSPTFVQGFHPKAIARKAYKAQEVDQGVEQTPLAIPNGVDVLAAEREERG